MTTPFDRRILVDKDKALNYIVQSTTADLVNSRAVIIDRFLSGKKSFISHIVHDEIVLDISDDERALIPEIRELFSKTIFGDFRANLKAGKDYLNLGELNL